VVNKQTITHRQMGLLFFVYMTGAAIITIPEPLISKAGSGAWLSLLISGGLGLCILSCVLFLHSRYPDLTYVEYSRKIMGTWLTAVTSIFPLSFCFHQLTGIFLEVDLFMISSMMRETPLYAFSFLLYMAAALTVRAGLEVMARMFMLIMLLSTFVIVVTLLLAMGNYHPEYLRPVMPDGIKPVFRGAYFSFGFPYGQPFLFAMLLPFAGKSATGETSRSMIAALVLNIIALCVSVVCTSMVFGPLAGEITYSLYTAARTVEVQEIISRIESIIGMALISLSYMKASITLCYLSLFVSELLRLKDYRTIVIPVALLGFLNTLVGYDSLLEWGEIFGVINPVWVFLALLPLLMLTALALFKKGKTKQE